MPKEVRAFCSCSFSHALPARYSMFHLVVLLSGGNIASPYGRGGSRRLTERAIFTPSHPLSRELSQSESLGLVCLESPSVFSDKHCFCGHKSEAPHEAGQNIILKLATYFLLLVIFHRNASTQTEDFHPRNKGSRKPYYIRHYCRSAKNHISIHEPKEMYVRYS